MNRDWRQSWPTWIAALGSAVFLALWWTVDDSFVWGFMAFAFLTALAWMRETHDWPRSRLSWLVWLIDIVFAVLWVGGDENFRWPFLVFLFLNVAMRAREVRPARGDQSPRLR